MKYQVNTHMCITRTPFAPKLCHELRLDWKIVALIDTAGLPLSLKTSGNETRRLGTDKDIPNIYIKNDEHFFIRYMFFWNSNDNTQKFESLSPPQNDRIRVASGSQTRTEASAKTNRPPAFGTRNTLVFEKASAKRRRVIAKTSTAPAFGTRRKRGTHRLGFTSETRLRLMAR